MISAGKKKKSSQNQNSTDTYTPAFSIDFTQDVLVFALCMWHCQILAYCIIFCILQICSSVGKKQQWKRQKKQSFNIFTVMQLYVASFFFQPILYVFIFHVHLVWDHSQFLGKEAAFPIEMIPALWKVPPSPVFHTQKDWLR